ncbi:NERD domain-containing protein [Macrococcus equipercicus]|uniref:NERD domain-containing protein n=1 Tax=Macrococcus equipercicus TaxID=69967 RepID=A0ABQ6RB09_9STAP|nr:nuclease-related domain-containing protein [Macrococcus equipercicus]KAA1042373.1 NERD domain-containing protein [Macrococcus equipercicus]
MLLKTRSIPQKIHYYNALHNRTPLSDNQREDYHTHFKGYEGEKQFIRLLSEFPDAVVLWDLTFRSKYKGMAQFDIIVIHGNTVTHYDIKNYKGIFTMNDRLLVNSYGRNFKNPDDQLSRAHHILEDVIAQSGERYIIESYLVFINEYFHLRSNNDNPRWLFRSMVHSHLKKFREPNLLIEDNKSLGSYFLAANMPELDFNPIERSEFSMQMKGMKCLHCNYMIKAITSRTKYHTCTNCGSSTAIKRITFHNLRDLYHLKGDAFTINEAMEWCCGISRASISRVLAEHFKKTGLSKATKYYL